MALLSSQRNTPMMTVRERLTLPVEASTKIYLGALVALDASGYLVPAQALATVAGQNVIGRASSVQNGIPGSDADNSSGSAGALLVNVERGIFKYDVDTSVSQASVGGLAVALNDHEVSRDAVVIAPGAFTIPASGALIYVAAHRPIIFGSVIVQNSGGTTTYVEGTDYYVDYQGGVINFIGSTLVASTAIKVGYSYSQRGAYPIAGRIVVLDPDGAWIDTLDKGTGV